MLFIKKEVGQAMETPPIAVPSMTVTITQAPGATSTVVPTVIMVLTGTPVGAIVTSHGNRKVMGVVIGIIVLALVVGTLFMRLGNKNIT